MILKIEYLSNFLIALFFGVVSLFHFVIKLTLMLANETQCKLHLDIVVCCILKGFNVCFELNHAVFFLKLL